MPDDPLVAHPDPPLQGGSERAAHPLSSSPEVLSVTARARRSLPPRGGGGPATGRRGDQAVQPPTSSAQWLGLIRPPHPTSPARGEGHSIATGQPSRERRSENRYGQNLRQLA